MTAKLWVVNITEHYKSKPRGPGVCYVFLPDILNRVRAAHAHVCAGVMILSLCFQPDFGPPNRTLVACFQTWLIWTFAHELRSAFQPIPTLSLPFCSCFLLSYSRDQLGLGPCCAA